MVPALNNTLTSEKAVSTSNSEMPVDGITGTDATGWVENEASAAGHETFLTRYAENDALERSESVVVELPENGVVELPESGEAGDVESCAAVSPENCADERPESCAAERPERCAAGHPDSCAAGRPGSCAALRRPEGGALRRPEGGAVRRPEGGAVRRPEGGAVRRPEGGAVRRPEGGAVRRPEGGAVRRPEGGAIRRPESGAVGSPETEAKRVVTAPESETDSTGSFASQISEEIEDVSFDQIEEDQDGETKLVKKPIVISKKSADNIIVSLDNSNLLFRRIQKTTRDVLQSSMGDLLKQVDALENAVRSGPCTRRFLTSELSTDATKLLDTWKKLNTKIAENEYLAMREVIKTLQRDINKEIAVLGEPEEKTVQQQKMVGEGFREIIDVCIFVFVACVTVLSVYGRLTASV